MDWFPPTTPTERAVLDELDRLLSSESFLRSPRARAFLAHVVTETLAGRAHRLSERTVGRCVFGRDGDFDGRFDAAVRVQATRVRRALRDAEPDLSTSRVRILLPAGSYVPRFESLTCAVSDEPRARRTAAEDTLAGDNGVAVARFASSGPEPSSRLAETVSEDIVRRLSTFPGIRVVGLPDIAPSAGLANGPLEPDARHHRWRFVLTGRVAVDDGRVRLGADLLDLAVAETTWSMTDTRALDAVAAPFTLEDAWAGRIAGEIGDYTGIVTQADSLTGDEDDVARAGVLAYYNYAASGRMEALDAAAVALERAMLAGSRSADVLAMRASTLAVRTAYGRSDDPEHDLARAEELARTALDGGRLAGHAHGALATVALVRRRPDLVRAHARMGAEASPCHPTNLATAGTLLAYVGEWAEGIALLRSALALSPHRMGYARGLVALDLILAGDDEGALAEASRVAADDAEWGPLYRAMALAGLGERTLARAEFVKAMRLEPLLDADPQSYFTRWDALSESQLRAVSERLLLLDEMSSTPAEE